MFGLKWFTFKLVTANELVLLSVGKGTSKVIVVRKKASLIQRQEMEMAAKAEAAAEAKRQQAKREMHEAG